MFRQFFRYGIAGITATLVHVSIVFLLVEQGGLAPALATIPAFLVALAVSYLMNHRWTFSAKGGHRQHFPRYAMVAGVGLGLNILIMGLAVDVLGVPYAWGLVVVVMVIPVAGFLLQRHWSFAHEVERAG